MSTDYRFVCFDCKKLGPIFASGSIAYGFKVWTAETDWLAWLGHREACGHHEGHDVRLMEGQNVPFDETTAEDSEALASSLAW